MSSKGGFRRRRGSKSNRPLRGYKSKTQVIAHNEAKRVVKRTMEREIETKQWDGQINNQEIPATGTYYSLWADNDGATVIAQGPSSEQYIGDTVKVTGLELRYEVTNAAADGTNLIRVLVIQVKGNSLLAASDILQSVGNTRTPLSSYDKDHMHEFRVLYDKLIAIHNVADASPVNRSFTVYIPGRKFSKVRFSNSSGDLSSGDIALMVYSDSTLTAHPRLDAYSRVNFKDA